MGHNQSIRQAHVSSLHQYIAKCVGKGTLLNALSAK